MRIAITFEKPYELPVALPPEGEWWVVRSRSTNEILIREREGDVACNSRGSSFGKVDTYDWLHPHIGSASPPTLADMPEGEVVVTDRGLRQRRGVRVYHVDGELVRGATPEDYQVYARPNAKAQPAWPKTVGELPQGCWCLVDSNLIKAGSHATGWRYAVEGNSLIKRVAAYPSAFIDLDADGRPIIYGWGPTVEVTA